MKVLMKEALCQEINASREDVSSHELNKSEFTSTLKDMSDNDGNLFHCSIAQMHVYLSVWYTHHHNYFPVWFCGKFDKGNFSSKLELQLANIKFDWEWRWLFDSIFKMGKFENWLSNNHRQTFLDISNSCEPQINQLVLGTVIDLLSVVQGVLVVKCTCIHSWFTTHQACTIDS